MGRNGQMLQRAAGLWFLLCAMGCESEGDLILEVAWPAEVLEGYPVEVRAGVTRGDEVAEADLEPVPAELGRPFEVSFGTVSSEPYLAVVSAFYPGTRLDIMTGEVRFELEGDERVVVPLAWNGEVPPAPQLSASLRFERSEFWRDTVEVVGPGDEVEVDFEVDGQARGRSPEVTDGSCDFERCLSRVPEGASVAHDVVVTAASVSGRTTSETVTVVVDAIPPELAGDRRDATIRSGTPVSVTTELSERARIIDVRVLEDGRPVEVNVDRPERTDGFGRFSLEIVTDGWEAGDYSVRLDVEDRVGNPASVEVARIAIDESPPVALSGEVTARLIQDRRFSDSRRIVLELEEPAPIDARFLEIENARQERVELVFWDEALSRWRGGSISVPDALELPWTVRVVDAASNRSGPHPIEILEEQMKIPLSTRVCPDAGSAEARACVDDLLSDDRAFETEGEIIELLSGPVERIEHDVGARVREAEELWVETPDGRRVVTSYGIWTPEGSLFLGLGDRGAAAFPFPPQDAVIAFGGRLFGGEASGFTRRLRIIDELGRYNPVREGVGTATSPPARFDAAAAYDPRHGVGVMFGGTDGGRELGDTWVYDGVDWSEVSGPGPSPRRSAALAWSPVLQRLVLFGGQSEGAPLGDTWTFDGTSWARLEGSTQPSARSAAAMVWDPAGERLLLVAGDGESGPLADTWALEEQWQELTASPPPAGGGHRAAHVALDQEIYLSEAGTDRVWTLEPDGWAPLPRLDRQGFEQGAGMVAVASDGRAWQFGGELASPDDSLYELVDHRWREVDATGVRPPPRTFGAMAWDESRDRLVLYGGNLFAPGDPTELWAFEGGAWSILPVPGDRPSVERPSALLEGHGGLYLLGRPADRPTDPTQVWFFDGSWTRRPDPPGEPFDNVPAFDPELDALVTCGAGCEDVFALDADGSWRTFEDALAPSGGQSNYSLYDDPVLGGLFLQASGTDVSGLFRWDAGAERWRRSGRTPFFGRSVVWVDEVRRLRRRLPTLTFEAPMLSTPLEKSRRPALRSSLEASLPDPLLEGVPAAWSIDVRAGGGAPVGGQGFVVRFWDAVGGRWIDVASSSAGPESLETVIAPVPVDPPAIRPFVDVSLETAGVSPVIDEPARLVVDRVSIVRRWELPNVAP